MAYVHKTLKLKCRFHGINVSSSWKAFVCDMNDAGNNVNYGFFTPYKVVQTNKMVVQFGGDTNNGNTFPCDLGDTGSFISEKIRASR